MVKSHGLFRLLNSWERDREWFRIDFFWVWHEMSAQDFCQWSLYDLLFEKLLRFQKLYELKDLGIFIRIFCKVTAFPRLVSTQHSALTAEHETSTTEYTFWPQWLFKSLHRTIAVNICAPRGTDVWYMIVSIMCLNTQHVMYVRCIWQLSSSSQVCNCIWSLNKLCTLYLIEHQPTNLVIFGYCIWNVRCFWYHIPCRWSWQHRQRILMLEFVRPLRSGMFCRWHS